MSHYLLFWKDLIKQVIIGPSLYYAWLGFLSIFIVIGIAGYVQQFQHGLIVTNMTDQVSWGAYIANFTYIVGLAAAAVMLVIPAYIYKLKSIKEIVLIGELLAVASIIMAMLLVMVDMGRPDRLWHLIPGLGRMNWPMSMLAWDVLVLNGYLLLNLHIPGYELYKEYKGEPPSEAYHKPFIFISIFWAISIHTVTAFLYQGLGGRPHWNSAVIAPRFLASAFAVGPCFILLTLQIVEKFSRFHVEKEAYHVLKRIIAVSMVINLFLLMSEVFKEFYTDSGHSASAKYLFLGLHENHLLVPFIWTAIGLNIFSTLTFAIQKLGRNRIIINIAAVAAIVGVWIEKGMGLIVPAFIPSPLGDIVEYTPSLVEIQVCAGIWAIGLFLLTLFLKAAIPIHTGELRLKKEESYPGEFSDKPWERL